VEDFKKLMIKASAISSAKRSEAYREMGAQNHVTYYKSRVIITSEKHNANTFTELTFLVRLC
jgi:hypothetical protein